MQIIRTTTEASPWNGQRKTTGGGGGGDGAGGGMQLQQIYDPSV